MPFRWVSVVEEVPPGSALLVEAAGQEIALFNLDGDIFAVDNTCTHSGGPLAEGEIESDRVTCPWHGSIFNIKTGEAIGPPAMEGVATCGVRVTGDDIEIDVAVAALRATENFSR